MQLKIFSVLSSVLYILFLFIAVPSSVSAYMPVGNYLEVNGGYVKGSINQPVTPSAMTIETWIYPTKTEEDQEIISIGYPDVNPKPYIISINGNSLKLRFISGGTSHRTITSGNIPEDTWTHIAVTISGTQAKLYINGTVLYTYNGNSSLMPLGSEIIAGRTFTGSLDEMRISTSALDIVNLWNSGVYTGSVPGDASTYVLWHFDEVRGQTVAADSSGKGIAGSLIGKDSKVHFAGTAPEPTRFVFPTRSIRRVFPTLSIPTPGDYNDDDHDDQDNDDEVDQPHPTRIPFQIPTIVLPTLRTLPRIWN